MIYGIRNKYNYTIKQIEVDYEKLTYRIGSIKMYNDIILTRKQMEHLLNDLTSSKFKDISNCKNRGDK